MFLLGLTGSIGMGKSTTAKMFQELGCAVWDADAAVHRLYSKNGLAVEPFSKVFPESFVNGEVSRPALKQIIQSDPSALKRIETIVHPLVAKDRADFLADVKSDIVVLDIPLLFETGGDAAMDATACVFVDDETQEARVLERGTMTRDQFLAIKAKQMPAAEKCAKSTYVIQTDTLEHATSQVQKVVSTIRSQLNA
ncbi:dephospho-CoA kinase [Sulfitobacter donghicola]|uniref:Dephospho-CoA kinase n=1 Tax=Sulfitobacter donghicola DSW-25 = KCTC 12864 = JCM 14565 TaxID=1300350 RepID=A0A073IK06_9RHOB|nr:dephospho-CoA kinase [Sulfitobacter donghicola]KEJ90643.1 dephospho-CoA kinase [Sulfitobacter donghicola DSW-25 = KCTC 12864 = JCM 14565]KIN67892.1 Dephospho-CoA kinase [Sulfitobacter donghicola DSW-25 = KCTC 12864 = JCM 14565]